MKLLKKIVLQTLGKRERSTRTAAEIHRMIVEGRIDEASLAIPHLDPQTTNAAEIRICLEGEIAFHRREDARAEELFRQALHGSPGLPDAHYGLSLIRYAQVDIDAASDMRFSRSMGTKPSDECADGRVSHGLSELHQSTRLLTSGCSGRAHGQVLLEQPRDCSADAGQHRRALRRRSPEPCRSIPIMPKLAIIHGCLRRRSNGGHMTKQMCSWRRADPSVPLLNACIAEIRELMGRGEADQAHALCEQAMDERLITANLH